MILDLQHKPTDVFINCFYSLIPMIEDYYKLDLSIIYSHSWNFTLTDTKEEILGTRIKPFLWDNIVSPFMPLLCGLDLQKNDFLDFCELNDVIEFELNHKNPVILSTDAFCCPWTKFYNDVHYHHHILIIGYKKDTNELIGYDSLSNDKLIFDMKILKDYFCGIYHFQKSKTNAQLTPNIIISDIVEKNKTMLDELARFQNLINNLDIEYEKQSIDNVDKIPLILRLDEICKLRKNYTKVINVLATMKFEKSYTQLNDLFLELSKEWEKCKLHFVKLFLSNRNKLKGNITETLSAIIENEKHAVSIMKELIAG